MGKGCRNSALDPAEGWAPSAAVLDKSVPEVSLDPFREESDGESWSLYPKACHSTEDPGEGQRGRGALRAKLGPASVDAAERKRGVEPESCPALSPAPLLDPQLLCGQASAGLSRPP